MLKITILLLAVGMFLVLWFGLWWLLLHIAAIVGIYRFFYYSNVKPIRVLRAYGLTNYSLAISGIIVLAIWVRVFLFEIYAIPSSSMEGELLPGDKIFVSKLNYGPALPRSPLEIPLFNLFFSISSTQNDKHPEKWKYGRLSGFSNFQRKDVMVFLHPNQKIPFIKRCLGLPGDTITVEKGKVIINSGSLDERSTVKRLHEVWFNNLSIFHFLDSIQITAKRSRDSRKIICTLNEQEAIKIRQQTFVDSIRTKIVLTDTIPRSYPGKNELKTILWSQDIFGPFIVPKIGMTIELNPLNYALYRQIINNREDLQKKLYYKNGNYYLGNHEITKYTFTKNYYFMMGDNRHNSIDSRFWGPIQEENIIGKASIVLFSNDENGVKTERLFKVLM